MKDSFISNKDVEELFLKIEKKSEISIFRHTDDINKVGNITTTSDSETPPNLIRESPYR
jgi:hypothetical protein